MLNLNNNVSVTELGFSKLKNEASSSIEDVKLKEVCNDFEAFFVQQILEVSLKSSTIAGEGVGSEIIKGLYTEGISKTSNGTFGISDMLFEYLSKSPKN